MAAAATAKAQDSGSFSREDGGKRRVLYAEDQASARVVTTALLERMGFEVVAVEDGELALEKARAETYDVILLDIEMPVMDGITAARCIREEATLCRETPILALSAFLADSTETSIWRDAFDSALPKPANSNELRRAMRLAIDRRTENAPAAEPDDASVIGGSIKGAAAWHDFGTNLPRGTMTMLVKVAMQEMNHLVLVYASCVEAGDAASAHTCKRNLISVAASFQADELISLLKDDASPTSVSRLLDAITLWHNRQIYR